MGNYYPQFSLRISEETVEKLRYIAKKHYRSATKEIEYVLELYIADYEKENGEIPTTWQDK